MVFSFKLNTSKHIKTDWKPSVEFFFFCFSHLRLAVCLLVYLEVGWGKRYWAVLTASFGSERCYVVDATFTSLKTKLFNLQPESFLQCHFSAPGGSSESVPHRFRGLLCSRQSISRSGFSFLYRCNKSWAAPRTTWWYKVVLQDWSGWSSQLRLGDFSGFLTKNMTSCSFKGDYLMCSSTIWPLFCNTNISILIWRIKSSHRTSLQRKHRL